MQFFAVILACFTLPAGEVAENFTGRVLEGSNDRLLRVERLIAGDRRMARPVVVLRDCGPLAPGAVHEFTVWADSAAGEVLPCLSVNGRPPEAVTRGMPADFGVLYGRVKFSDPEPHLRVEKTTVEVRCGDRVWSGQVDRTGRFWSMAPPGGCSVTASFAGHLPVRDDGWKVEIARGGVAFVQIEMKPWGVLDRFEWLFQRLLRRS